MSSNGVLTLAPRYHRCRYIPRRLHADESTLLVDQCPACGSTELHPLGTVATAGGRTVLERSWCAECTLVMFTRRPDTDWYKRFYESAWDPRAAGEVPKDASYHAVTSVLVPFLPDKSAHILEMGCGYGGALQAMQQAGYEQLYGLEASRKRAEHARSRGFHVALCTAEELLTDPVIASGAPYDAVFSYHVFEHLYQPDATVENVAQLLKPGGLVFVCVPHFEAEHFLFMTHYLPHIFSYTERSLCTLFERRGFQIEHVDNSLRIVARKAAAPPPAASPSVDGFGRLLKQKFIRDFGLRRFPQGFAGEGALRYSQYRGDNEILEPSYGSLVPLDATASRVKLAMGRAQVRFLGMDVDQARLPLMRKLARRTLGRQWNELIGDVRFDGELGATDVDHLQIHYCGEVVAYVK